MKPILEIEGISKRYRIGHQLKPYLTIRDSIVSLFTRNREVKEEFWALKDITFNVDPGDAIAIIGKNGAGKSTLLKVFSKITHPTSGRIIARGRIASLLEVGTGFHPELTGRENVFLNGSILGLRRYEILNKFDEIVDFSGVEKFLDTPLKHFSTGMQLRLAFAVAAHLEPEILAVDEVLAVGDVEFQKKCLTKMSEVTNMGMTLLFVSHNMSAVQNICNKAIYIENGKTTGITSLENAINQYTDSIIKKKITFDDGPVKWISINCDAYDSLEIALEYQTAERLDVPNMGFIIASNLGQPICGTNPVKLGLKEFPAPSNAGTVKATLNNLRLANGTYRLSVWFGHSKENIFWGEDCLSFEIDHPKKSMLAIDGPVMLDCEFEFMT